MSLNESQSVLMILNESQRVTKRLIETHLDSLSVGIDISGGAT